ncbi:hematopoietic progenitor cell antigen CD34-like [Clupea harengus]|uniref:Hematopoietic progenitor cell antigen CD34-like n=1 Tax=Clupea harengus TaxID=7950 RepID=A0A6P3VXB4_CLUHA|nr:hematopoietic progenitor cell antigen CD34-like [Clupea harengus]
MMRDSTRRMNDFWGRMSVALLFCALLLQGGFCQDDAATDATDAPAVTDSAAVPARGDGDPTDAPGGDPQTPIEISVPTIFPLGGETDNTGVTLATTAPDAATDDAGAADQTGVTAATTASGALDTVVTQEPAAPADSDTSQTSQTPVPHDSAGSDVTQAPAVVVQTDKPTVSVECVSQDAVKDKTMVKIELESPMDCNIVKKDIEEAFCRDKQFCEIFITQEENMLTLSGETIEENAVAASKKLQESPLKDALGVLQAEPVVVQRSSAVLCTILVIGLLVAAGLIAGYMWMNHRRSNNKGMRLAGDSYPVDEENQGNTLMSVAPLNPPEPQEKPSINGESLDGVKTQVPAATNGHSTAKTPVADTEL